jgi:ankyrin repeat protein
MVTGKELQELRIKFFKATEKGNIDSVKKLLEQDKILINTKGTTNKTAIHLAAINGNCDLIKILIKYGINIHATTKLGHTALDCAKIADNNEAGNLLRELKVKETAFPLISVSSEEFYKLKYKNSKLSSKVNELENTNNDLLNNVNELENEKNKLLNKLNELEKINKEALAKKDAEISDLKIKNAYLEYIQKTPFEHSAFSHPNTPATSLTNVSVIPQAAKASPNSHREECSEKRTREGNNSTSPNKRQTVDGYAR